MDLQALLERKMELEQARTNVANSWQVLTGHIAECDHMISLAGAPKEDEVGDPVANDGEVPVV